MTLRAALNAQPYLDQWLDAAECEDANAQTSPEKDLMTNFLDLRERAVVEADLACAATSASCSYPLPSRRSRKSRAVFDEHALEQLVRFFKRNPKPRGELLDFCFCTTY